MNLETTDEESTQDPPDGRVARRQRNIDAVLDATVELFSEGDLFPSIEEVSKRSGVSIRSLYRYFADAAELSDAAIARHRELAEPLAHISAIGEGPLDHRIEAFAASRLRLHDAIADAYRATVHNAPLYPRVRDERARTRLDLREQFERQFAPELGNLRGAEAEAVLAAGDLLTQLDAVEFLRRDRDLSVADATDVLVVGLRRLLGPSANADA